MTRENLIKAIYDNDERWSCSEPDSCSLVEEGEPKEVCMKCAERMLDRYEQEIREKALEDYHKMPSRKRKPTDLTNKCGSCAWAQPRRGAYIDCTYPCKEPLICARTKLKCKHYEHKEQKND